MNFHYPTLAELKRVLEANDTGDILIVCDERTFDRCLKRLNIDVPYLVLPAGESHKSWSSVDEILSKLVLLGVSRNGRIINLGGGVVCDIGGFAASIYQRGISFINIPTSLMAMADAGFGGKTAINYHHIKNFVGSFVHPTDTYLCSAFLETLPEREILSGWAEIVKHSLLSGEKDWLELKDCDPLVLKTEKWNSLIRKSNGFKWGIVKEDFKDLGIRKSLNFGHTIGHAIESVLLNKRTVVSHGEAVVAGIICELELCEQRLGFPKIIKDDVINYLSVHYQHLPLKKSDLSEILEYMKHDKKNVNEEIRFCLLQDLGVALVDQSVGISDIRKVLTSYISKVP